MKTKIISIDGNWVQVKNACRTTVNKLHTDNIPTSEFKTKLLISEHSPIRKIKFSWIWENILSWVSVHWSRHKWECFISTQRSDRTGVDRKDLSQNELVNFEGDANAQHLIDTMRKRLCYQASKETRELAEDLKLSIMEKEYELANVLVPNCVYRCGCSEFETCGFWNKYLKNIYNIEELVNIKKRYSIYNMVFMDSVNKKGGKS